MYNVIIWGTGKGYNQHLNLIKYFEMLGEISVVGIISNDKEIMSKLDGYKYYPKFQIKGVKFDYCLATMNTVKSIYDEAETLGILKQKIIPIRVLEIPYFSFKKYICLKEEGISILSRNCWGGLCYHYLALEFQSPTINMFFSSFDFNKFITNLDHYLSLPIEFVEMRYERNLKRDYPVGRIDDIILNFNHYIDFEDAVSAWTRRKKRMRKNIVVISSSAVKNDILQFLELPYKNKLIFIPKELNIRNEASFLLNDSDYNNIGMYSNGIVNGQLSVIDILSLLCQMDYHRTY